MHFPDHNTSAWTILAMVAWCLLSEVSQHICQHPSVQWSIKLDSSENATWCYSVDIQLRLLVYKFQLLLAMDSNQHRCMNHVSASEAQAQQHSLNSSLGDTVVSPLFHLLSQLLNNSMSIRLNASRQPLFTSVIYVPWWTKFAMSLILDSPILPCMVYFYHGCMQKVFKLSHFGNVSTLGPKASDHALSDVRWISLFLHYINDCHVFWSPHTPFIYVQLHCVATCYLWLII